MPVTARAPRVEGVLRRAVADVARRRLGSGHDRRLARQHLLGARRQPDVRLALADDELRRLAIGVDVDPVQPRPQQLDLRIRRVDARRLAAVEDADADDQVALRDEQRELRVVEAGHVDVGVAGEAELAAAVIDLGAAFRRHPEVVAGGDRRVEADARPVGRALPRRQEQLAGEVGHAADAARQVGVRIRGLRERGDGQQQGDHERQHCRQRGGDRPPQARRRGRPAGAWARAAALRRVRARRHGGVGHRRFLGSPDQNGRAPAAVDHPPERGRTGSFGLECSSARGIVRATTHPNALRSRSRPPRGEAPCSSSVRRCWPPRSRPRSRPARPPRSSATCTSSATARPTPARSSRSCPRAPAASRPIRAKSGRRCSAPATASRSRRRTRAAPTMRRAMRASRSRRYCPRHRRPSIPRCRLRRRSRRPSPRASTATPSTRSRAATTTSSPRSACCRPARSRRRNFRPMSRLAATQLAQQVGVLKANGANYILAFNIYDWGKSPYGVAFGPAASAQFSAVNGLFNSTFNAALNQVGGNVIRVNRPAAVQRNPHQSGGVRHHQHDGEGLRRDAVASCARRPIWSPPTPRARTCSPTTCIRPPRT